MLKIRGKLLVLLLAIAVVPLAIGAVLNRVTTQSLGNHLASGRGEILTRNARDLLQTLVDDYGRMLARDRAALEQAVLFQAREVERRLADDRVPERPLFHSRDYDAGERLPEGMKPSPKHFRSGPEGKRLPIAVTYTDQVFFVVEGVNDEAVAEDMARLSTMPPAYRFIYGYKSDLMYWQYTAMESGFHTSYPGHGGYPVEYDPRVRKWYELPKEAGALTWVVMPEVSTRTVALTVAAPVRRKQGQFAGVTAIDIPLTALFQALNLPEAWAGEAETLLVVRGEEFDGSAGKLVILAQQSYETLGENWKKPVDLQHVESEDTEALAKLRDAAAAERPGVRRMRYRGEDALWAHGSGNVFPIVIVPSATILASAREAENYVLDVTGTWQRAAVVIVFAVMCVVALIAVISSRSVTEPARRLAQAAQRLAGGDYEARVDIHTGDEMEELGEVFNAIGPQLHERERIKRSLGLAMEVQRNLLPSGPPSVDGLDIAGHSIYCDETGGDYYDFLEIIGSSDKAAAVAVGDVMGHGIAAALLMATARGVLRSRCRQEGTLADLLTHMNDMLVQDTGGHRFMTMLLMVLDAEKHEMRWASAGHGEPLIYDPEEDQFISLAGGGVPLGIVAGEHFEEYRFGNVRSGQIYLASTDGSWETSNPAGKMFGMPRLQELVRSCAALGAEAINQRICEELARFRGDRQPDDDVTMVTAKVQ